uniref:Energy transducer TonB n=1 Tax=Meloidogyne javanica TaxID=6303 RepID=A0A915LT80_MELJA
MSASEVIPNLRNPVVQKRMKSLFTYRYFGMQSRDSMLYSAIAAVLMVHVVLGLWIHAAWDEGKESAEFEKED